MKKVLMSLLLTVSMMHSADNILKLITGVNDEETGKAFSLVEESDSTIIFSKNNKWVMLDNNNSMSIHPLDSSEKKGAFIINENVNEGNITALIDDFRNGVKITYFGTPPNGAIFNIEKIDPTQFDADTVMSNIEAPAEYRNTLGDIVMFVKGGKQGDNNTSVEKNLSKRDIYPFDSLRNVKCEEDDMMPQGSANIDDCVYQEKQELTLSLPKSVDDEQGVAAADEPTQFDVSYTKGIDQNDGSDIVTPSGDIVSNDQKIEWIEVNGERIDINAMSYSFSGSDAFSGTTLNIDVKLEGKDALDNYSA